MVLQVRSNTQNSVASSRCIGSGALHGGLAPFRRYIKRASRDGYEVPLSCRSRLTYHALATPRSRSVRSLHHGTGAGAGSQRARRRTGRALRASQPFRVPDGNRCGPRGQNVGRSPRRATYAQRDECHRDRQTQQPHLKPGAESHTEPNRPLLRPASQCRFSVRGSRGAYAPRGATAGPLSSGVCRV